MKHLVILLSILNVLATSCEALLPGEIYWNNVLPETQMPKIIETLLKRADRNYDQFQSNSFAIETTHNKHIALPKHINHEQLLPYYTIPIFYKTQLLLPYYSIPIIYKTPRPNEVLPENQFFFTEEKLWSGDKISLSFPGPSTYDVTFISREVAQSIPFSYSKLSDILDIFSVEPNSAMGEAMKSTLLMCESPSMHGEIKSCLTSLESMVDFCTATLGTRDIVAKSTTANKENPPKQQYEIMSFSKKDSKPNMVLCHALNYVHAVFFCHKLDGVDAYDVSLVGTDGTKVDAVATCHTDTSRWDPNLIALQILGLKPGTAPVCHVLPQPDIIWMPKN